MRAKFWETSTTFQKVHQWKKRLVKVVTCISCPLPNKTKVKSTKILNIAELNCWIFQSNLMHFFKFLHEFVKLIHVFLKVVTWIRQSCSLHFSLFAKQNQAEVWPRCKACWSFCFDLKILIESTSSMPWVNCAFA